MVWVFYTSLFSQYHPQDESITRSKRVTLNNNEQSLLCKVPQYQPDISHTKNSDIAAMSGKSYGVYEILC